MRFALRVIFFACLLCWIVAGLGVTKVGRHGATHLWPIHSHYVGPLFFCGAGYIFLALLILGFIIWLVGAD